jgi:hypothetical protein
MASKPVRVKLTGLSGLSVKESNALDIPRTDPSATEGDVLMASGNIKVLRRSERISPMKKSSEEQLQAGVASLKGTGSAADVLVKVKKEVGLAGGKMPPVAKKDTRRG